MLKIIDQDNDLKNEPLLEVKTDIFYLKEKKNKNKKIKNEKYNYVPENETDVDGLDYITE